MLLALFLSSMFKVDAKPSAKPSGSGAAVISKWKTQKYVSDLNFSPLAQRLVWLGHEETKPSGSLVYSIHCSNYRNGKKLWNLRLRNRGSDLTFSPDGKTLAYISGDEHLENDTTLIRLIDAATGRLKHTIAAVASYEITGGLEFSPDGKTLAYGSYNQKHETGSPHDLAIVCLDTQTRKATRTLHALRWGHVTDISFSPDGRLIAATTFAGHAGVGDLAIWRRTGKLLHYVEEGDWHGVDFLSNRRLLAGNTLITYNDGRFSLHTFSYKSTEPYFLYSVSKHTPVALVVKDAGYQKWTVEAWQAKPRKRILTLALRGNDFHSAVSSSQNVFALAYNGEIKVWRVRKKIQ